MERDFQVTTPAKDVTAISVLPPPMSTVIMPTDSDNGRRAPIAASNGFWTRKTSRAPAESAASSMALRSTSVVSSGTPMTMRGRGTMVNDSECTLSMKYLSIFSATSKSEMTPFESGLLIKICGGVLPSISLASRPTARIWSVRVFTATTDGSWMTMPLSTEKTSVWDVPKSIPRSFEKRPNNRLSINETREPSVYWRAFLEASFCLKHLCAQGWNEIGFTLRTGRKKCQLNRPKGKNKQKDRPPTQERGGKKGQRSDQE